MKEVEATGIGSKAEDDEGDEEREGGTDAPPWRENRDGRTEEACNTEVDDNVSEDGEFDDDEAKVVFFPLDGWIVLASVWRGHTDMMIRKVNSSVQRRGIDK